MSLPHLVEEVHAEELVIEVPIEWTPETIETLSREVATDYGLDPDLFSAVVKCESTYNPTAIGDGGNSHGLVQIYMPVWGKEVTLDQAYDPEFALNWMAQKWVLGEGNLWSCYRKLL